MNEPGLRLREATFESCGGRELNYMVTGTRIATERITSGLLFKSSAYFALGTCEVKDGEQPLPFPSVFILCVTKGRRHYAEVNSWLRSNLKLEFVLNHCQQARQGGGKDYALEWSSFNHFWGAGLATVQSR